MRLPKERSRTMARSSRKKVQFFEVCDENGDRFDGALPWEDALAELGRQQPADRRHVVNGVPHWGRSYPYSDCDHFVLARLREEGVSTFDINRDEFIDQESQSAVPFVEITIASILPSSNKFGLVRGSNAASHASTIGDWINQHQVFERPISIVPLISQSTMQKIASAREVKLLRVRYAQEMSPAQAIVQADGAFQARLVQ